MIAILQPPLSRLALLLALISSLISLCSAAAYNSTALVFATDAVSTDQATYLLNGYGIAYQTIVVPDSGITLPALEDANGGNYGLLVLVASVQNNGTSILTQAQWNSLYAYQNKYGVRMVQLDVVPTSDFGVSMITSCCDSNTSVEQNLTMSLDAQSKYFPTAGLRSTNLSTVGLYHFAAAILDANKTNTIPFINFQPNSVIPNTTVAGVINLMNDREQMAFFIDVGNWSTTSTMLGHMWVQWGYRGMLQGYRRINVNTQVDDLFLQTAMYSTNEIFRLRDGDLDHHVQWTYDINTRLNNGSSYFTEFGFNANGNLIYNYATSLNMSDSSELDCQQPVVTDWDEPTQLEFIKPLGTGVDKWPLHPDFVWSADCIFLDPLTQFLSNTTNRDAIGLVSHTFTHLELNGATYHDTIREIQFNLMYAEILNITNAARFSGSGLIPPAITGLHNGDALRAWSDNGLWNAIGDNTRPALRNADSFHWPKITTVASNGHDGYQITPRFATRIYYNCDKVACDLKQWVETENGTIGGTFDTLLMIERQTVGNQLLSLFHDPYMFHQPNLRNLDVDPTMVNGRLQKLSLLEAWTETIMNEMMRLVTWPLITLKHDHVAMGFAQRMVRDACKPHISYQTNTMAGTNATNTATSQAITGFTVYAGSTNECEVPIPVTIPGGVEDARGSRVEQIGTDSETLWVQMDGSPQGFILRTPIYT